MLLNLSFLSLALIVNNIALLILAFFLFSRRESKGAMQLSMLMFVCALWSFCVGIQNASLSAADKIFWAKTCYIAVASVGPLWLLFAAEFSQLKPEIINSLRRLVWIVPLITVALVFTNEVHECMWPTITPISDNAGAALVFSHGILFFLHMTYAYILLGVGTVMLIRFVVKENRLQRKQVLLLCFAILFPWLANLFYVFVGSQWGRIEVTPFAMTITGLILAYTIYRYKLFMTLPEAKDAVFQGIKSGIVIVDKDLLVIDSNHTAKKIFGKGLKRGAAIHKMDIPFSKELCKIAQGKTRNSELYLEHMKMWVDVQISELSDFKEDMSGYLMFFYDITALKKIQLDLEESKRLSAEIIDFLPDALFVLDSSGKVVIWNKAVEKMTNIDAAHMIGKGDNAYSVPFYGKKRPGLAGMILDPSLMIDKKLYKNLQQKGDVLMAEVELAKSVVWAIAKPLYNQEGKIVGAIESIRDITDRRSIENELTERVDTLSKVNSIMLKREERIEEMKRKLEKLTIHNS